MKINDKEYYELRQKEKDKYYKDSNANWKPISKNYKSEDDFLEALKEWENQTLALMSVLMENGSVVMSTIRYFECKKGLPKHTIEKVLEYEFEQDLFILKLK